MSTYVEVAAMWLFVLALHGTCWLGLALLASLALRDRAQGWQQTVLRLALLGPLGTSLLQLGLGGPVWGSVWGGPGRAAVGNESPAQLRALVAAGPDTALHGSPGVPAGAPEEALQGAAAVLAPEHVAWFLLSLALALAGVGLLGLLRSRKRLADLLRTRRPETDARVLGIMAGVCAELGLQNTPRLSRCPRIGSPIAFGVWRPEISLPERIGQLGSDELRALFAHELEHLRSADAVWLWLGAILQALLPWQLLIGPVRRRLHVLAELRCDAVAAERSSAVAVAECLVQVAEWQHSSANTHANVAVVPGALAMASKPTLLRRRVEAALARRRPPRARPVTSVLTAVASLAVFTAAAPGFVGSPRAADPAIVPEPLHPTRRVAEPEARPPLQLELWRLQRERDELLAEAEQVRAMAGHLRTSSRMRRLLRQLSRQLNEINHASRLLEAALTRTQRTK